MRAWIRWDTVSVYDDPEGWVRRVAYNLGVSRWRKARRLLLRPSSAGALPSGEGLVSDGSSIGGPGESIGVIAALLTLPVPERRAVVLHHVAGLSVEEVAAEVGSPVGTVKSWLSRGRGRLQAELESQGVHNHG